ncbi:MAG: hypothetical protein MJA82_18310 [Clostridia bacterium]|nr:hypothetical protein [Clostridia bacterium]
MRESLKDIKHMVKNIKYKELPSELEPYNYYVLDSGHCIMSVLQVHLEEAKESNMDDYEIPLPVRYVLDKGYKFVEGYVVVEAEYSSDFGVVVDEKYYEY